MFAILGLSNVALRKESVDRNLTPARTVTPLRMSLSARRAWIEMATRGSTATRRSVALRKESVDRNLKSKSGLNVKHVALRKESVDRNNKFDQWWCCGNASLSARRAWIEMHS